MLILWDEDCPVGSTYQSIRRDNSMIDYLIYTPFGCQAFIEMTFTRVVKHFLLDFFHGIPKTLCT